MHFEEKEFERFITEDDMEELVFKGDGWIVKKYLNVFVKVGKTDHESVIDS